MVALTRIRPESTLSTARTLNRRGHLSSQAVPPAVAAAVLVEVPADDPLGKYNVFVGLDEGNQPSHACTQFLLLLLAPLVGALVLRSVSAGVRIREDNPEVVVVRGR